MLVTLCPTEHGTGQCVGHFVSVQQNMGHVNGFVTVSVMVFFSMSVTVSVMVFVSMSVTVSVMVFVSVSVTVSVCTAVNIYCSFKRTFCCAIMSSRLIPSWLLCL